MTSFPASRIWGEIMFVVNDDLSIYATRGDIVFFSVSAKDGDVTYKFQPGDIVRISVYGKKDAESVVLQKDFPVNEVCESVFIYLEEADTKFDEIISKHKDYWYEVVLNPDTSPQTIIGYDEDGAKIFRLFPESDEIEDDYNPQPEDFPVVDEELDMTSPRPVANSAIARAVSTILDTCERANAAVAENFVTPQMYGAIGDGKADDTEAIQAAINAADEVLLKGSYKVTAQLDMNGGKTLIVNGELISAADTAISVTGSHNKITGTGKIIGYGENCCVKMQPDSSGVYSYYNVVDVKEIREFACGIWLYNPEENGIASYFNVVDKTVFTECKTGIRLEGWANGNKLTNLVFYACGEANSDSEAAIVFAGDSKKYPIENMLTNISTTNAENCTSVLLLAPCKFNHFSGLEFENGGDNARGFYALDNSTFTYNTVCGLSDINNQGSTRGKDNTILASYGGKNDMSELRVRRIYQPGGFKMWLKKKDGEAAFGEGVSLSLLKFDAPAYAVFSLRVRALFVSSAAGDKPCAVSGEVIVRKQGNGQYVTSSDNGISVANDGTLADVLISTPNSVVGTAHYQKAMIEIDILSTYRDASVNFAPAHYGMYSFQIGGAFEEYSDI